jgi:hypothetical protein
MKKNAKINNYYFLRYLRCQALSTNNSGSSTQCLPSEEKEKQSITINLVVYIVSSNKKNSTTPINAWRKHYNLHNSTKNYTYWVLISSQANGGYLKSNRTWCKIRMKHRHHENKLIGCMGPEGDSYLALVTPFTKECNGKCLQNTHDITGYPKGQKRFFFP